LYPCGYVAVAGFLMLMGTTAWRYRLVDITPEFAAEQILRTITTALLVLDHEGVIQVANRAACRLFRREEAELLGTPLVRAGHDLLRREQLDTLIRTGWIHGYEVAYPVEDGAPLTLDVSASVIRDRAGEAVAIVWTARDISGRKSTEHELQLANAKLAQHQQELMGALSRLRSSHEALQATQLQLVQAAKMESVGRLAAGVAHEVKNPLAIILMGVEYLTRSLGPQANGAGVVLQDIASAVRRADLVVRGLLDFSVARDVEATEEELNVIVEQSLLLVKHQLMKQHVAVAMELATTLPTVRVDRHKMEQVFVNILMNAIQAMGEGGVLTVRTYTKRLTKVGQEVGRRRSDRFRVGDQAVVVEVDDTGCGIPKEAFDQIFDPFFTTKPTGQGTGLGLTVTKHIVALHGGSIELRNRSEGGVRATIMLRAERADLAVRVDRWMH